MQDQFSRTRLLLGEAALEKLAKCRVAVFGVGGVGGYVCEALVRSGVGAFDLVDDDQVALTNLNRQIIATHSTLGRDKVEVMAERMRDINPAVDVRLRKCFFLPENADEFPFDEYDYGYVIAKTGTAEVDYGAGNHVYLALAADFGDNAYALCIDHTDVSGATGYGLASDAETILDALRDFNDRLPPTGENG